MKIAHEGVNGWITGALGGGLPVVIGIRVWTKRKPDFQIPKVIRKLIKKGKGYPQPSGSGILSVDAALYCFDSRRSGSVNVSRGGHIISVTVSDASVCQRVVTEWPSVSC